MDALRQYLAFYDNCRPERDSFVTSLKLDFGLLDTKMIFDFEHGLFCMNGQPNKTIFEGKHLRYFIIREDSSPLFEGSPNGLTRYTSIVPGRIAALAPEINMAVIARQMAEAIERQKDDDDQKTHHRTMDVPEPFRQFNVELHLEHPYWKIIKCDMSAPKFNNDRPSVSDYMQDYREGIKTMEQLALSLMRVAFPGAGETVAGASAVSAEILKPASADPIDQIKKFKTLMEDGVITPAEFEAKKKQLLGI
jgi:hypothetical protein